MSDYGSDGDDAGGYTLEEYDVGPTQAQQNAAEVSSIDFRMDAPPPSAYGGSMEQRFKAAGEMQPPEGMQLARPSPACCPGQGGSSHTGPKAVKADYERAKQHLRDNRMREQLQRERALNPQQRIRLEDIQRPEDAKKANDSDDSDEDDDAAFEAYKQQRIAFVQNSLPRFGVHTRVSKLEFANLVKSVHELVYVVCHVYQNNIEACTRLNLCLESLAPQFPHVRFCRLRAREAMGGFHEAGLPALLVYKGGHQVTFSLRCTDPLPRSFSDLDVARLLQAKGILTVPTGLKEFAGQSVGDAANRQWSDDENEEAEEENQGASVMLQGLNLLDGTSGGSTAAGRSAAAASSGGGRLQKSKFTRSRVAESGSDSDD